MSRLLSLIGLLSSCGVDSAFATRQHPSSDHHANDESRVKVIERDIAVIGGGASGTYAAVRLKELNQSVVLIEQQEVLGGHTNTYIDPTTGVTIDYGVQYFHDFNETRHFFGKFDIPPQQ